MDNNYVSTSYDQSFISKNLSTHFHYLNLKIFWNKKQEQLLINSNKLKSGKRKWVVHKKNKFDL